MEDFQPKRAAPNTTTVQSCKNVSTIIMNDPALNEKVIKGETLATDGSDTPKSVQKLILNFVVGIAFVAFIISVASGKEHVSLVLVLGVTNAFLVVYGVILNRITGVGINSAYGRYSVAEEGSRDFKTKPVEARLAWFIMESPSFIVGSLTCLFAPSNLSFVRNWMPVLLFLTHYFLRTIVMGMLTRGGKPFPLGLLLQGVIFTMINGWSQVYYHLFNVGGESNGSALGLVVRFAGLVVFLFGMGMNHYCDYVLRNLRKDDNDKGYYIPQGYFFTHLSAPNLVGEIIEWIGYFMFSQTIISLAFAVSTMAIVGNRAIGHHRWYTEKFKEDYPKERKRLIPWVY